MRCTPRTCWAIRLVGMCGFIAATLAVTWWAESEMYAHHNEGLQSRVGALDVRFTDCCACSGDCAPVSTDSSNSAHADL